MRKTLLIISLLVLVAWSISAQQPLKIAVISDTHYLSTKIAQPGLALDKYESSTGRNVKELHQVLNKVLSNLISQQPDILLIPGDLTNNGALQSHLDFATKLNSLKEKGTRIFVVPGNHDVNVPNAKAFVGNKPTSTATVSAERFEQIYAPFGYDDAIKRDTASLSYLAKLNDKTWLLGIDSNKYKEHTTTTITSGKIAPETMQWVLNILQEAKEKNILVLGMMHHGLVEHMPYQATFMSDYLIDNLESSANTLADHGLKLMFTGHYHSNDISKLVTAKGNTIYDVETGSLAGYPFPYRLMTLDNNTLNIESFFIDSVPSNSNLQEEYRLKAEKMTKRIAKSKIDGMSLPIPSEVKNAVVDLIVKMQILHMKGDEKMDDEMLQKVQQLSSVIGNQDADSSSFKLDSPPADNFVEIEL